MRTQTLMSIPTLMIAVLGVSLAVAAPPPPTAKEDTSSPDFTPCRDKLARLVGEYDPLSHPPAPKPLTKDGDLSYDRAWEYTQKLRKVFEEVKNPAFRKQCEGHLALPNNISANYHLAYTKMEERLKWHEEALVRHCDGHITHSRQQGSGWLTKYSNLKNTAAKIENSKSVVDDMADVLSARGGEITVKRSCEVVFSKGSPKLQALSNVCVEEMAEYNAAHQACDQVCGRLGKKARCDVFSK